MDFKYVNGYDKVFNAYHGYVNPYESIVNQKWALRGRTFEYSATFHNLNLGLGPNLSLRKFEFLIVLSHIIWNTLSGIFSII